MLKRLRETTATRFVPVREQRKAPIGNPQYSPDHLAGDRVAKGGSMCANCKFLRDAKNRICGEPDFIAWEGPNKPAGSPVIPLPLDEYCSDWYKMKKGKQNGHKN